MTNKEIVLKFYDEIFNAWTVEGLERFMREDYKQHNQTVKDGRAGFIEFAGFFFQQHPKMRVVKILEDGDMVCVFFECTVDSGVNKVCDLYRLQDGLLAEHWDVVQHLKPDAPCFNSNGNF